jgi:hypothetical protein
MMWVVIFHLACLALALEFIYRAPEYDDQAGILRYARRRRVEPEPRSVMGEEAYEGHPEASIAP